MKRITSLFLAIVLMLSIFPAMSFAEGADPDASVLYPSHWGPAKWVAPNAALPTGRDATTGDAEPAPTDVTRADMDSEVTRLYDLLKARFIREYKDTGMWFLNWSSNTNAGTSATVSEAHGYAMLSTVLMAGHDPSAQTIFNGMIAFYKSFQSTITNGLMAWEVLWDGSGTLYRDRSDGDSATDGDMDIAYALLLADRVWGSDGGVDYLAEAKIVINALASKCINPTSFHLKVGDWASNNLNNSYARGTRPSDFMFEHMKAFYEVTGDERWAKCIEACYQCLADTANPTLGVMPDFCLYDSATGTFSPAPAGWLEGNNDPNYHYNSCRVPWRIGVDMLLTGGDVRTDVILTNINNHFKTVTNNRPASIRGYNVQTGAASAGGTTREFSVPALVAAVAVGDTVWANRLYHHAVNYGTSAPGYYPGYVALLSLIAATGNWWSPIDYVEESVPMAPEWPFDAVDWILFKMDSIDLAQYGYQQYDDVNAVKRALGVSGQGSMGSPLLVTTTAQRSMFTSSSGEYYDKYQALLDQEAQMIKLWLADLAAPRDGETWQHHMSRIAQTEYMFVDAPGYYGMVEAGRRVSILGANDFYDNADAQKIMAWQATYEKKFQEECFKPGKAVEKMIDYMDPANADEVAAARAAYDVLDNLSQSCVMNYQKLTRAEGLVNEDGTDQLASNFKWIGMRKEVGNSGVSAAEHKGLLGDLLEAAPGAKPFYIWISGNSSGQMRIGTTSWNDVEAAGVLQYPREYYTQMGLSLATDNIMEEFFSYMDTIPGAEVYVQVENMNRMVEPQMDVLRYLAVKHPCVKGFAMDIEWYNHNSTDCGLKVSDYRAQVWNEYIYKTWGSGYSLALKHYDAHHLPENYRGGTDNKSNPVVFIDDTQNYGSWDGSHGGRYNAPDVGNGSMPGNGNDWAMFAEYFYPNPVIFQTGYQHDEQWSYEMEDPYMRSHINKIAEVTNADQPVGVAWVNFNRNGYPEFPNYNLQRRTATQLLGELASRTIAYLSNYNGDSNNLLGGNWGYFSNDNGRKRNEENNPLTIHDALWVRNVRSYANILLAQGATGFTSHTNYSRFIAIEPRAVDIRIAFRLDIVTHAGGYKASRDQADLLDLADMYDALTDDQKALVTKKAELDQLLAFVTDVAISSPVAKIVAGYAANIPVDVAFKNEASSLTLGLYNGETMLYSIDVSAAGRYTFALTAVDTAVAGVYTVKAVGARDLAIACVAQPDTLWTPKVTFVEGVLTVEFGAAISAGNAGYKAVLNGVSAAVTKTGDNVLTVDAPLSLQEGSPLVISGVKYAELFPSYSFTFTLAVV